MREKQGNKALHFKEKRWPTSW